MWPTQLCAHRVEMVRITMVLVFGTVLRVNRARRVLHIPDRRHKWRGRIVGHGGGRRRGSEAGSVPWSGPRERSRISLCTAPLLIARASDADGAPHKDTLCTSQSLLLNSGDWAERANASALSSPARSLPPPRTYDYIAHNVLFRGLHPAAVCGARGVAFRAMATLGGGGGKRLEAQRHGRN